MPKQARFNFTSGRVADLTCEPGKVQSLYWDATAPGLGVRVSRGGTKAYIFERLVQGRSCRITIGDVRTWALDDARREARRLSALVDRGIDPREVARDERAKVDADRARAQAQGALVADAWTAYITYQKDKMGRPHIERGKKWGARHLRDHEHLAQAGGATKKRGNGTTRPGVLYPLLQRKLGEVTPDTVKAWLRDEAASRPNGARQGFEAFRAFWRWCATRAEYSGIIDPAAVEDRELRDEVPSRRSAASGDVLQREHLCGWFAAVRSLDAVAAAYLQALLLTGARREEMASLRWEGVDFRFGSLLIADKVEGKRTIPLTPYLASLLSELPRRNEWVFSSPTAKGGRIVEPREPHQRALLVAGLPHVTIHGLRRSFSTLAEWIEMPTGVVAQIMGHKPSATAERHYKVRPLDVLRKWHTSYEKWILGEAGIEQPSAAPERGLRVVGGTAA